MAPRKHLTAHEMKRDEFVSWFTRATIWVEENARTVLLGIGVVAALFVLVAAGLYWHRSRQEKAYSLLADVQRVASTPLAGDAGAGPGAFPDARERASRVVIAADTMLASYPRGMAAMWARFARAEALLELGRAEEAVTDASAITDRVGPDTFLGALAGILEARAEEARGNPQRAADLYGEVAAGAAGSFPPEAALLNKARCLEKSGETEAARSAYQEILDLYPDSPLGSKATRALEELGGATEGI